MGVMGLSTADLRVGDPIVVVVSLACDTMVDAVVMWATAEQFMARSQTALHRGWVAERMGGRGLAFCEAFRSDLGPKAVA